MATTTVRISRETHATLNALAHDQHLSIQAVLERAVRDYQRRRMLELGNDAYAQLRSNPNSWAEELEERALWEATLADGLEEAS